VLRNTDRNGTEADVVKDRNTILLLRQNNENITICIMNFEDKPVTLELAQQKKQLFVLLNSSGKDWNKIQNVSLEKKAKEITINAKSVILLSDLKG
jgi:G:T/U-mismatch repair DNA glycosylase